MLSSLSPHPPSSSVPPSPVPLTRLSAGPDGVKSVEGVGAAGDVRVPPEFDAGELEHLLEDGGAGEAAGEGQRREAHSVHDAVLGGVTRVAQRVREHALRRRQR